MEDFFYKAPVLRLDVGQFAKVRAEAKEWKVFDNAFHPEQKESRLPVRVLEGEGTGQLRTIRTRSDDPIFQTIDLAKKVDIQGLEFWIKKFERKNSKGNDYTFFVLSLVKPSLTG